MPRYHVIHETRYDYDSPVSLSQQLLHQLPRICAWQCCEQHRIDIEPQASWSRDGFDAFGNPVRWLCFDAPHEYLAVRSEMLIEVMPHLPTEDLPAFLAASPAWEDVRDQMAYSGQPLAPGDLEVLPYLFESPYVRVKHQFADYAADCFPKGRPVLLAVQALMAKIFKEFKFDPEATSVATPVLEVLANKRGVCQDFAHLMIACLRAKGLPARYVSGYLLTQPPPGKPRLIGADASHAWVSVYCPGLGATGDESWVDFDPTNNLLPDTQHITLAWARDFGDVSPLRGIILGGGNHEPDVAVTVTPLDEEVACEAAE